MIAASRLSPEDRVEDAVALAAMVCGILAMTLAASIVTGARRATRELRRAERVSEVSHELRGQLANLSGWVDALEDGLVAPDATLFATLKRDAGSLRRLVDDLRDVTADRRLIRLMTQHVALHAALADFAASARGQAARAGIEMEVAADPELTVVADPVRLRQLLSNLVGNAIRHTPPGGRIVVTARRSPSGETARLSVSDTGTGIEGSRLPRVFDRNVSSREGGGLGLAIVRAIAEAHGGRVSIESRLGEGTTVLITLPTALAQPACAERRPSHDRYAERKRGAAGP